MSGNNLVLAVYKGLEPFLRVGPFLILCTYAFNNSDAAAERLEIWTGCTLGLVIVRCKIIFKILTLSGIYGLN